MKPILLPIFFSFALLLFSCKKEEGCTDESAVNYSSSAEIDDMSCTYSGKMVFWFDEETSAELESMGVTIITFYVDEELEGGNSVDDFVNTAPECTSDISFNLKKDLGTSNSGTFSYYVNNQYAEELWSGTVTVTGNNCTAVELSF